MSLNDHFKVAILPLDIYEGEKEANVQRVICEAQSLPAGTDLLVLPELFSTGYICEAEQAKALAEDNDGPTIRAIKRLSCELCMAVCGSYLATDGEHLYNRGFIIEPNGDSTYYDKRHLFCISAESKICQQGTQLPPVVRYRGWNISLAICYDLRFPAWLRNTGNKYDILVLPANWPDKRAYAWEQLLKARAIENECYVIGANRSGEDEFGTYTGLSQVYDYMGKDVGTEDKGLIMATISKPALMSHRKHFPAWKDADGIIIER